MKGYEYIAGDYLLYKGYIVKVLGVYSIRCHDELVANIAIPHSIKNVEKNKLEGLPLRSSLLLGNGWKKQDFFYFSPYDDALFAMNEGKMWHIYRGRGEIMTLQYVHQLQHLLFGLGLGLPEETISISSKNN